ncbi:hypothetical protein SAMN02982931_04703 [Bauldia litoralis]|uniref:Helix-turn-helix domain-containing protein n=1 Tax=Bauldia litoralis TaxID=665467 RepID=A0A1G6EMA2_9HYPH|nr:hypothetical protein SAMN02982931_04703 [Bauldia litoralis]
MTANSGQPNSELAHLTQHDLAQRWRLSHRTLEKWRSLGTGVPYLKVGGRVLYRLADVEAFEVKRKRLPAPDEPDQSEIDR